MSFFFAGERRGAGKDDFQEAEAFACIGRKVFTSSSTWKGRWSLFHGGWGWGWEVGWGGEGLQEPEQLRLSGQQLQTCDHQPKGARFATKDKRHTFQRTLRKARLSPALVSQLNLGDICGQFFCEVFGKGGPQTGDTQMHLRTRSASAFKQHL